MQSRSTTRCLLTAAALVGGLSMGTRAAGDLITFDPARDGDAHTSFSSLASSYFDFTGATDGVVGSNHLPPGTRLANQYADRWAATLGSTWAGYYATSSIPGAHGVAARSRTQGAEQQNHEMFIAPRAGDPQYRRADIHNGAARDFARTPATDNVALCRAVVPEAGTLLLVGAGATVALQRKRRWAPDVIG